MWVTLSRCAVGHSLTGDDSGAPHIKLQTRLVWWQGGLGRWVGQSGEIDYQKDGSRWCQDLPPHPNMESAGGAVSVFNFQQAPNGSQMHLMSLSRLKRRADLSFSKDKLVFHVITL